MILQILHTVAEELFKAPNIPQTAANQDHLQAIINIVFGVLGSVAVLVITIAGFRFVLHQGDPGDTVKARNAIVYAIVGLVVALSAWVIVSFVIGKV